MQPTFAAFAVASLVLASLLTPGSPAAMVYASQAAESVIALALVDTHALVSVEHEVQKLTSDVNAERTSRGVAALKRDASLDRFAKAKALDMAGRSYFGHTSPDGITFQDRMRTAKWPAAYVSENIAFDVDELMAHRAFVNSPPHFGNLMDPRVYRIGVAVINVGNRETFYVEDFSE